MLSTVCDYFSLVLKPRWFFSGVGNGDGSDIRLEIVMDSKIVHSIKFNELDKDRLVKHFDHIKIMFSAEDNINVCGDVKFRFISSNSVSSCLYDYKFYSCHNDLPVFLTM